MNPLNPSIFTDADFAPSVLSSTKSAPFPESFATLIEEVETSPDFDVRRESDTNVINMLPEGPDDFEGGEHSDDDDEGGDSDSDEDSDDSDENNDDGNEDNEEDNEDNERHT